MKEKYVRELVEGEVVDTLFALSSKELRSARTGDAYLAMELSDRSGRIGAVLFRPDPEAQAVPVGSVVRARGIVTTFRGVRRVSVETLRPEAEYDAADMIPAGRRDADELMGYFEFLEGEIADRRLAALVAEVFGEPGFLARFAVCPAAQVRHHAYAAGLLEHTVSVASLCQHVGQAYDRVDDGLLLAAALLHDVGKVDELELGASIGYSDVGRMVGHVVLGERRVGRAVERLGGLIPEELALRLAHILLSHHGELEWGAPKRPCVLEALILHHVDNLDAKVAGFMEVVAGASRVEERWTDVTNLFRRPLYVPRPAEDDRSWTVVEDDQYSIRTA